jgi:hypothetical protein
MKFVVFPIMALLLTCCGCGGYSSMSNQPAAMPVFSPAPGTFTSVQNVTITDTTPGAIIYYTTDGSVPTTASPRYVQAIPVPKSTTIRAVAVASGYSMSNVATGMYIIVLTP